jgi:eukaryotic-like serine/threonine-protein kinase
LRIGVENDQAIANSVLPGSAAHNLILGGELLVATTPGPGVAVLAAPVASGPKTIEEALQTKTSYSFASQSLEFAMRDLADDVQDNLKGAPFEFAIKIIGGDLEKDGITRNQTVRDFQQENQTVADILTALVRKANPITTVKDPSEADQKLLWVIAPDPDSPGKQVILITTRAAAAAKKYTLPAVFVAKKT